MICFVECDNAFGASRTEEMINQHLIVNNLDALSRQADDTPKKQRWDDATT
jgi:hypothetical protein